MFTNNWFEITGKENFEKFLLPQKDEELNLLEVGCYEGRASTWMLENLPKAKLTVVDTFKGGEDLPDEVDLLKRFEENTAPYRDRIDIAKGKSGDLLKYLDNNSYDFIYIDGSHLACSALEDAVLSFPLLKENGIMIFDDYTWGAGMCSYDIPSTGIDAFLNVYGNQLEVLARNSQAVIRKIK